jgi:hypothetical protein
MVNSDFQLTKEFLRKLITVFFCLFHFDIFLFLTLFYFLCITHNDAPQAVGLLWTSDQLVTETST